MNTKEIKELIKTSYDNKDQFKVVFEDGLDYYMYRLGDTENMQFIRNHEYKFIFNDEYTIATFTRAIVGKMSRGGVIKELKVNGYYLISH